MHSRADSLRVGIERAFRAITLLVIVIAAWSSTRPTRDEPARTTGGAALRESLARWTAIPPRGAHVSLEVAPQAEERDWLRALRRAGTAVTWRGDSIPMLALEVAPAPDPRGGTSMWVVAPAGARVALADAIAPIDTLVSTRGGAMMVAPMTTGTFTAALGPHHAAGAAPDSLLLRRVLVLGPVTWETKFIITALEEAGWAVDARLAVAPGMEITQGARRFPDTALHSAVVVVDAPTSAAASAVTRYVRSGGGVILAGTPPSAAGVTGIAAGRVGPRVRPSSMAFAEDGPRRALSFREMRPREDAIVLEEREGRIAAAARRVEAGRVVQLGYEDTWRWRLAGGEQAPAAHSSWWTALVSSVAYRPVVPLERVRNENDAPLARLVDAVGPPTVGLPAAAAIRWAPSRTLLFILVSALLLMELASRRLRGAP